MDLDSAPIATTFLWSPLWCSFNFNAPRVNCVCESRGEEYKDVEEEEGGWKASIFHNISGIRANQREGMFCTVWEHGRLLHIELWLNVSPVPGGALTVSPVELIRPVFCQLCRWWVCWRAFHCVSNSRSESVEQPKFVLKKKREQHSLAFLWHIPLKIKKMNFFFLSKSYFAQLFQSSSVAFITDLYRFNMLACWYHQRACYAS